MKLLMVTPDRDPAAVLPALGLLDHAVAVASPDDAASALAAPRAEAVLVDARRHLARALHVLAAGKAPVPVPVLAVVEGTGLVAVSPSWHVADFLLRDAGPAEVDARLRLRQPRPADQVDLRSDPAGRNPEVLSRSSCGTSGATSPSSRPGPSTSTSGDCEPSSDPTTHR